MMAQPAKRITLEDIWSKGTFAPRGIQSIRSMQDGEHYCVLTRTGIDKYSYKSGEKEGTVCSFGNAVPAIEDYEFSADEQKILLSSGFEPIYRHSGVSDYYIYDMADGGFTKLTGGGKQRLTTLSPDGTKVAYVRDNNLYYMELEGLKEHQITSDGRMNAIINGTTDWVYEEEFAITQGFYWSPDSKRIAYYRFDESGVKEYTMQMWGELYPENYTYKYPKAGEDNSVVDIYIYSLDENRALRLNTGSENDQYLPRMQWTNDPNQLAFMRMNRLQNKMELLVANATTGKIRTLYTEEDKAYVEVPETWKFLADGKTFLLNSEKNGYNHLYLYNMEGQLIKQVTSGDYDVVEVCAIDEKAKRIYYTSHEHGAINKSLSMVEYGGKKTKTTCLNYTVDAMRQYLDGDELQALLVDNKYVAGTYAAKFSEGCKYYICIYSNANMPPIYTLHDSKGKLVKVLQDNAQLRQRMAEYGRERKEFGTLTTSEGIELNYYIIKPANFDENKQYPLFFYVYGGPGNQQVTNSYGYSDYYWFRMLAQKGYVVACFDGRGTGGRGADWKKVTYRNLGHYECIDAIEAAKWFGKKPWIDESRIGIFGWSFGGYLSSLCILKGNDVFKSAIAVAPVITWRYYDNIYTERFLQRPQENPDGYDNNSPLNFADRLKGNYLLVHGTGDDNVHFQNAADMVTALEKADKQFEFRIYPNKNHSIYGGNTRLNLYKLMTDFIERKL
ncbi:MAG: DPP IV N-terminal domain-containing protein [Bacteroidales bacterium]|nr:DPP IV N-terminal domain-containing protein [Bacteroidales bacterium]